MTGAGRWTAWLRRDPRQARFLTAASWRWMLRHRAFTPWYLVRYWRLLKFRIAHPHIIVRGMVFLGRDVEIRCHPGHGRMEIGRWTHFGDGTAVRCHEGSVRIGDKVVFGRNNTVNCWLDIEIGATRDLANWAHGKGVRVFFITGRREPMRAATQSGLARHGFPAADGLFLKPVDQAPDYLPCGTRCDTVGYKSGTRAHLEAQGNTIIANLGDQNSDLAGGHAERGFKLPNPVYTVK